MNQVVVEETSFEEVLSEIEENSKYKRLPPKEKNMDDSSRDGNSFGIKEDRQILAGSEKIILNAEKSQDK